MDNDEEILARHVFEPYMWDETRCGYIDGDDMMCGYSEGEHPLKREPRIKVGGSEVSLRTWGDSLQHLDRAFTDRRQRIAEYMRKEGFRRDEMRCCWIRGDLVYTDEELTMRGFDP
jgi:hypothetical protein